MVKKFYILPRNFLVVSGSVLKIGTDIHVHWTLSYTQRKIYVDVFFVCDIRSKESFGAPEAMLEVKKPISSENERLLRSFNVLCRDSFVCIR